MSLFYVSHGFIPSRQFKVRIETLEQSVKYIQSKQKYQDDAHWRRSGIFIVNFEHISHFALVFLLLVLSMQMSAGFFIGYSTHSMAHHKKIPI